MSVVVIDGEIGSTCWSIHKQGCGDIKRTLHEVGLQEWTELDSFDSTTTAVSEILNGDGGMAELGYNEQDIKIFNCAR